MLGSPIALPSAEFYGSIWNFRGNPAKAVQDPLRTAPRLLPFDQERLLNIFLPPEKFRGGSRPSLLKGLGVRGKDDNQTLQVPNSVL